jgi:hypothetical protein
MTLDQLRKTLHYCIQAETALQSLSRQTYDLDPPDESTVNALLDLVDTLHATLTNRLHRAELYALHKPQ